MDIALNITGLDAMTALFQRAPALTEQRLTAAMHEAQMLLQREVAEATPTGAHQLLRKSIIAGPVKRLSGGLLGVVEVEDRGGRYGSTLDYAVAVELGTKPHFPPIAPLVDWVKAKLGERGKAAEATARAIAWKISHHGTEGAHMFQTTHDRLAPEVQAIFDRAIAGLVAELGA